MGNRLQNDQFLFEYLESYVEDTVLWERHCHIFFEMITVLEGWITIVVEGQSYTVKRNQTIIIPPLCYHTVSAEQKGVYRRITATFYAEAIPSEIFDPFTASLAKILPFQCNCLKELKEICTAENPTFYAPLANSLMIRAFYDCIDREHSSVQDKTEDTIQKLILYIDEHIEEKILLEDLAACITQSKSSIGHMFQEKMNISPKQYILQKKLAYAEKLIREGIPITAAAKQVGYDNYSNFYRMYRKHVAKDIAKN